VLLLLADGANHQLYWHPKPSVNETGISTLFCWQPATMLFSHTKSAPATSHQPPVLFSHNKSAPATLGFVIGFLFAEVVLDL